jgi:protein-disulfide isomerase
MQLVTIRTLLMAFILALCACANPPPPAQPPGAPAQSAAEPSVVDLNASAPGPAVDAPKGGAEGGASRAAGGPAGEAGNWGAEGVVDGDETIGSDRAGSAGAAVPGAVARGSIQGGMIGGSAVAGQPAAADAKKDAGNPLPVSAGDPSSGKKTALVTLVEFADFECPYCKKAAATLTELRKTYGPDKLRIVWKNNPLPFHTSARPAAETAMALFESGGDAHFWAYYNAVFGSQAPTMKDAIAGALQSGPMSQADVDQVRQRGNAARKVDADIELAKRVGVTGAPAFFINGVFLSGAQPTDKFRAIIDQELGKAKELLAAGVPQAHLYDVVSAKNFASRPPPARAGSSPAEDKDIHFVPVGASPVRGKPTALITLVVFSDFQCPFCQKANTTVSALEQDYGDKIRVVFKHNPLPFHPRAEPAAELAIEAKVQKGDAGFWNVHDLLWKSTGAGKLEDKDLASIAQAAGLRAAGVTQAILTKKHKDVIAADQDLADDLKAHGTPHFFVNGRRLVGAQPIDKFKAIIDEQLALAQALVAKGIPAAKVYDEIQKTAVRPAPPERKSVPAAGKDSPARGPAGAKVTIQVFSDFQCPFCKRIEDTLSAVIAAYPTQVRVVWRNKPLPMHRDAALAAEASLEAFRQKGDAGFWKMHERLFKDQSSAGLDRAALDQHAAAVGLDAAKFAAALDSGAHKATVERDLKIAEAAGISATPACVINGYFISGAQPLAKFRKLIDRALKEAK